MSKKIILLTCLIFININLTFAAQRGQGENITITTYYPSPYGSYNELSTNRLVIGKTDAPKDDGVVKFQPLSSAPANSSSEGALYYNSSRHAFQYHNGPSWVGIPRFESGVLEIKKPGDYYVKYSQSFQMLPLINVYAGENAGGTDVLSGQPFFFKNITGAGFTIIIEAGGFTKPFQVVWFAIGQ
jgi:hypothetical protein